VSVTGKRIKSIPKEEQFIIKNAHEAIIPREIFEAVKTKEKIYSSTTKLHLFTNVLFYADCGTGMLFRSNRGGYICGAYAHYGKKACIAHATKEDFLKEIILNDIQTLIQQIDKEQYIKKMERKSKSTKSDSQKKINKINKQMDVLKNRNRKFINLLADETITHEEHQESIEANNDEITDLMERKMNFLHSCKVKM